MAGERVDPQVLIEHLTRLATDHADLVVAVRIALLGVGGTTVTGDAVVHIDDITLQTLRRLTGSP